MEVKEKLKIIKEAKTLEDYLFINNNLFDFKEVIGNFKELKIAILRSSTLEPIIPFLKVALLKREINPTIFLGEYNSINQNLLKPDSWIEKTDVLLIWFRWEDLFPEFLYNYEKFKKDKDKVIDILEGWIALARKVFKGKIIITNLEQPSYFPSEFYDSNNVDGIIYTINDLNFKILEKLGRYEGVYFFDLFKIQLNIGIKNYYDSRLYYMSKFPYSSNAQKVISEKFSRMVKCLYSTPKKVLVLDLDNTLWGGIIGEDGISGIKLGPDFPGNFYLEFQRKILNLYNQGIVLAISSKNNFEDAINVFKNHPHMVLKEENFAVMKIDWNEKEKHLKEISGLLNLGLDSFVFIDDSPFECERVRQAIPEVFVVNLPSNPLEILNTLDELEVFDVLSLTEEDKQRGKMYKEEAKREELKISSFSIEEFYRSLKMEVEIGKANKDTSERIAQLTQRTNQFNLTTKRYTLEDILTFSNSPNYRVFWARLKDTFGDYGIISTSIIKCEDKIWIIDTFLLSCRAIQKTVESAFLAYIIKKAKKLGVEKIMGKIIYTKKNIPARDFYKNHNFTLISKNENEEDWVCNLENYNLEYPEWFKVLEV